MGLDEFQACLGRVQQGSASKTGKVIVSKYVLDNHMLASGVNLGPKATHDLFKVVLKHHSEIFKKICNLRHERREPGDDSSVFQDIREAKAQQIRNICSALRVPRLQAVEVAIDPVAMQRACQDISEKKGNLHAAFGMRYRHSSQSTQGNTITKRGLGIVDSIWSTWGFMQIAKHHRRKPVSHFGEQTYQALCSDGAGGPRHRGGKKHPVSVVPEHASSVRCPGTLSQHEHSHKATWEVYKTLDNALERYSRCQTKSKAWARQHIGKVLFLMTIATVLRTFFSRPKAEDLV